MDIGFYCTDCWCPSPRTSSAQRMPARRKNWCRTALRPNLGKSCQQASRRRQKGSVAEAESCTQEAQRFGRQVESIRSKVLPVSKRQDVGPKTYICSQTPGHGPGKQNPGFRAWSNRRCVAAMIPQHSGGRQPIRAKTNPWTKGPSADAQGQICGKKRIRAEAGQLALLLFVATCARTVRHRRVPSANVPGGGRVASDLDLESNTKRPNPYASSQPCANPQRAIGGQRDSARDGHAGTGRCTPMGWSG